MGRSSWGRRGEVRSSVLDKLHLRYLFIVPTEVLSIQSEIRILVSGGGCKWEIPACASSEAVLHVKRRGPCKSFRPLGQVRHTQKLLPVLEGM